MEFMGGDINDFINNIAGYKSTISVGVGIITMHSSKVSERVLQEYNEVIQDTAYNLDIHLRRFDEKLADLTTQDNNASEVSIDLEDERKVTKQCLRVCEDAKSFIESLTQRESAVLQEAQGNTSTDNMQNRFEAQFLTRQALDENRAGFVDIITRLQERLDSLGTSGDRNGKKRWALQEDIQISRKCLEVCNMASETCRQGLYGIGEMVADGDSDQVVVTTLADLFDIKKASFKGNLARLLGSMTEEALRNLADKRYSSRFGAVVTQPAAFSQQTQEELDKLDPSRQTSADQRRYLTRIAAKYQSGVTNALRGNYNPGLEADSPLKLRMHIRNLNDKFADTMARNGHTRVFRTTDGELDQEYARGTDDQDIYAWIHSLYRDSHGAELPGTVHPNVLMNMFCEQSLPWKSITEEYLARVGAVVSAYNEGALASMVGDDNVRRQLEIQLRRKEEEAMANAKEQLRILLNDERRGPLQTVNHYFADNLAATREERSLARLKKMGFNEGNLYNVQELLTKVHQSNDDQAVDDIHDTLKSFYKVAMKRFNDNVVVQVVERCILGDEGAFQALTPELVGDMTDRALQDVAGENYATSSARNELVSKISQFQRGLEITRQAGI